MIPKFRAWWIQDEVMTHIDTLEFLQGGIRVSDGCWHEKFLGDEVILMQSTGLKDKNGVEIFEGDVCKLSGGLDDYWYIVEWLFAGWQLVTYKKPNAKVRGISDGINQCYLEPNIASNLVIVGNIHENPELLERTSE